MKLVEQFAPHLPYLRRFARALTGSQENGDKYVRAAVQALAIGGNDIEGLPAKLSLYRLFLGIWGTSGVKFESVKLTAESPADRVRRLPPLSRQTFLLKVLEGFSDTEISQIIDKDIDSVHKLLEQADDEIAKALNTNVLIIEDEPMIAVDLKMLVEDMGHTVDCLVVTHTEALDAVAKSEPGLILADIQLADGSSGLEAVNEILSEREIPVIFITAFPEKLLTGERPEPTYLITKPFESGNVKAAISQALFFGDE